MNTFKETIIIEPKVIKDSRGWFTESYSERNFPLPIKFIQDNHSHSAEKGVLRGLHFQNAPFAQSKLVRCTRGAILDLAVDLRKGSPTYKKWQAIELSADDKKQFFIPKGFAHAFLTLTEHAEVQYKTDQYYSPEHDRSIAWNDPDIGIKWEIENPILSDKDKNAPTLSKSDCNFVFFVEE